MIIRTKDFQIPKKLDFETSEITNTYGKFFAEPFERGFGTTVGNSLRRVLLSSIAGAAITSIKIEGVLHEFSTLPGVKEDITDIILNLKSLRVKLHSDRPKTIYLKKNGPCEVRAKDIIHDADVEILTPDLPIATLDKDSSLNVEMNVKIGRGYVPAERNKEEGMSIGTIPVDSIFSPIKRINFYVENARVGRVTDYDKLILEIWTDGSVRPDDALAFAAKILKDHLALFINFEETAELIEPKLDDVKEKFNKNLLRSVNELELSVRAANCLKNANIKTISDLVNRSENEMLKTKNFGRKSLNEIKEILSEMGLSLGMKLESVSKGVDNEKEDEPSE
ncbi:MAG TPA: DNA-directed RNA polymerase subunit alpha [Nitrospiria bacterium]|jgi:DNA-directed RNA polymerase subunit alpha